MTYTMWECSMQYKQLNLKKLKMCPQDTPMPPLFLLLPENWADRQGQI